MSGEGGVCNEVEGVVISECEEGRDEAVQSRCNVAQLSADVTVVEGKVDVWRNEGEMRTEGRHLRLEEGGSHRVSKKGGEGGRWEFDGGEECSNMMIT